VNEDAKKRLTRWKFKWKKCLGKQFWSLQLHLGCWLLSEVHWITNVLDPREALHSIL
jgi:hypothetical protein